MASHTPKPRFRKSKTGKVFDTLEKLEKLKQLMRLHPTLEDTAAFFECSQRTIEETIRVEFDLTFREFRRQNAVHTRLSITRKAIEKAKSGDNTMLIFCLKNLCGWKDKYEDGSSNEKLKVELSYANPEIDDESDS